MAHARGLRNWNALREPDRSRQPLHGFTLVELLVVIGIIAVLIAMLFPSLSRARESANQTRCLSNLRNIAMAMLTYANENTGFLYSVSLNGSSLSSDFVWWDAPRFSKLAYYGIAPYLNVTPTNYAVLLCPSDNIAFRSRGGSNPYPFSYTMNWMTTCNSNCPTFMPNGKIYPKITDIPHTSQTILTLEEDENTIDDGSSSIWLQAGSWSAVNLLAVRHDHARSYPDNATTGLTVNGNLRGNVGFCDGHAEYVTRWFCASKSNAVPVPGDFPNDPETEPPGP